MQLLEQFLDDYKVSLEEYRSETFPAEPLPLLPAEGAWIESAESIADLINAVGWPV